MNDEKLAVDTTAVVEDSELEADELDVPEAEVRNLLYNTENLRKQSNEQGEDAVGDEESAEVRKEEEAQTVQE